VAKLGTKNQLERDAIFVLTDCALQAQQRLNQQINDLNFFIFY
jgi:hypothetical protein